jgi:hypothetical protein
MTANPSNVADLGGTNLGDGFAPALHQSEPDHTGSGLSVFDMG